MSRSHKHNIHVFTESSNKYCQRVSNKYIRNNPMLYIKNGCFYKKLKYDAFYLEHRKYKRTWYIDSYLEVVDTYITKYRRWSRYYNHAFTVEEVYKQWLRDFYIK